MKELKQLTFNKACKIEGIDPKQVNPDFSFLPEQDRKSMLAHTKMVIMVKVANRIANDDKPWMPDFDNGNEWKYEPRFVKGSSGFQFDDYDCWHSCSRVGSRLCFINYDTMKDMVQNKNYMKVYNDYAL